VFDTKDSGNFKAVGLKTTLIEVAAELASNPREIKLPTMRELAKKAGVAPGAAYRHFESQDALFIDVIRFLFEQLEETIKEAIRSSPNSDATVGRLAQAYVSWGLSNPGGYQLLFETTDEVDMPLPDERPGLHLITQLAQLLSKNSTPDEASIQKAIQVWISMHGLISLRMHKTGMPWRNTVEEDVNQLIRAIGN
jgi:AcrR family transcriptional regulator